MDVSANGKDTPKYKTDYIKSNYFRVIHADGVFGGVTPRGYIQIDVWSERQPIPQQCSYDLIVQGDGTALGKEDRTARMARDAVIREVEAGIVIDLDLAKSVIKWLEEKVAVLENLKKSPNKVDPS